MSRKNRERRHSTVLTKQDPPKSAPPMTRSNSPRSWAICVVLFVATLAVYAPVRQFAFLNYDDPSHVSQNVNIRRGLTLPGVVWAFTSGQAANWFPVTRLSHMLDVQLFGLRSGMHHLMSVLFHALAAILLFAFLVRATRAVWPSALVAFLFALHPLHVESVAWVAERKDVLCALFWFLGLWAYVRYAERPSPVRYLVVLVAFCLGLMAKPMIVTFPLVLLIVDAWPLRRLSIRVVREKIPFFVLSAGSAIVTYLVQQAGGAVQQFTMFPLGLRVENALTSYVVYIAKMFWSAGLAVFYSYPAGFPVWQVVAAGLTLGAISFLVIRGYRNYPYLLVGWFWYLVTLVPVIGLVQVGGQARADRYTYVPMVGLTIMVAWGAADVVRRWPRTVPVAAALATVACVSCASLTWAQVHYWKNDETLYRHALAVSGENNYKAHNDLGLALLKMPGRVPEAMAQFQAAVRIRPDFAPAHRNLGLVLSNLPRRQAEAIAEFQAALRINPQDADAHNYLGLTLSRVPDRLQEGIDEIRAALRINPEYAEAHNNLGMVLESIPERLPEAITELQAAVRLDPDFAEAHNNLGMALANVPGRLPEAITEFQAAVRLDPEFAEAHSNLGLALAYVPERVPEAIAELRAALRLDPDSALSHTNLGLALTRTGRLAEAIPEFEAALRLRPNYPDAHNNLGLALSQMPGRLPEAIAELEAGQRIRPDPGLRQVLEQLRAGRR